MLEFVCKTCADATALREAGLGAGGHDQCKGGTWCDCQHRLPKPPEGTVSR